jgi:hypothetical protein
MMAAAESAVYYPHHEGGRGSPMRIHDVAGKSAVCYPPKLGIRNLSPHLRNSAILRTTKTIAELRTKKSCGTVIADLENLTYATFRSLLPVRYFLVPFPQLRLVLKVFFICFSGNRKLALKG